jgi:hypothetical protein
MVQEHPCRDISRGGIMIRPHPASWIPATICILAFLPAAAVAEEAGRDTTWVPTFTQEFHNWPDDHIATFDFPPGGQSWDKILLYYTLACPEPPGSCDPWDRIAYLRLHTEDEGGAPVTYEIARVITPYDIDEPEYPGSCTWRLNVSEFETLLRGPVTLSSYIETWIGGDRGWLVTATFAFVPGDQELEPYRIINLWNYSHLVFGDPDNPIEDHLAPLTIDIDPEVVEVRLRATVTGHGQGNTDNAAEFAMKWHEVVVGEGVWGHNLWDALCPSNPCSPQGGNWTYPRAGWCPGKKVAPWKLDVTNYVTPGEPVVIDYNVEAYENLCRPTNPACVDGTTCVECAYNGSSHTEPHFAFDTQLVFYRSRAAAAPGEPDRKPGNTLQLEPTRPNPSRGETEFAYWLDEPGEVSLAVYAAGGRFVREMSRSHARAGRYTLAWDGTDRHGTRVPSGTYFFELTAWGAGGEARTTRKLVRLP